LPAAVGKGARAELSGRQFDPKIVDAFLADEHVLRAVYEDLSVVA
jgi:response regulator RpfG family c-di-GMP phosphodiesterase